MRAAGVPVVPGSNGPLETVEEAQQFAKKIGFPLLIKAALGGGGRGIRLVQNEEELPRQFDMARTEAASSFGKPDGTSRSAT